MRTRLITPARVGRVWSAAVTVGALLAGCGSGEAPAQRTATEPGNPASTRGTAQTSPKPPEASTSPASPKASNGTDLAACKDADCEVEVRPGDRLKIDARFGVDAITVKSLGGGEIRLALEGSSGGFQVEGENVSVKSACTNDRCRDEGELSLTADSPGRVNDVRLRLAEAGSTRAVLVLLPR